ncbi:hypothetical protein R3I94_004994 [Phoxinus phoxinus]
MVNDGIPKDQRGRHRATNNEHAPQHKNPALQSRLAYQADVEKDWQRDTSMRSLELPKYATRQEKDNR